jgi:hypothetical protein
MLAVEPKLLVPDAVQQGCEISAIYGPAVAQVSFRLSPTQLVLFVRSRDRQSRSYCRSRLLIGECLRQGGQLVVSVYDTVNVSRGVWLDLSHPGGLAVIRKQLGQNPSKLLRPKKQPQSSKRFTAVLSVVSDASWRPYDIGYRSVST